MDIQLCNCIDLIEHLPSTQAVNFALITSNTFILWGKLEIIVANASKGIYLSSSPSSFSL